MPVNAWRDESGIGVSVRTHRVTVWLESVIIRRFGLYRCFSFGKPIVLSFRVVAAREEGRSRAEPRTIEPIH